MTTLSPLRYPGGKSKLFSKVTNILNHNKFNKNTTYVEPFAGGGGLALKLLKHNYVEKIILNDIDYSIYSFWYSIINETKDFIQLLLNVSVTIENWHIQKHIYNNPMKYSLLEVGFATFYLNRTNRSGIIKGGVIGGKDQKGSYKLDCRFNKDKLIEKIQYISDNKNKISIYNMDVTKFVIDVISPGKENYFINFDPPYFQKGSSLYTNYYKPQDHINLKTIISACSSPWILTYDKCNFIKELYTGYKSEIITLNYSLSNNKTGDELLIYSHLVEGPPFI